jgi:hypothetical protein
MLHVFIGVHPRLRIGGQSFSTRNPLAIISAEMPNFDPMQAAI